MSITTTETTPRRSWWQRRRLWIGIVAIAALALIISAFASVEETRLVALDAASGRAVWSIQPSTMRHDGVGAPVSANGRLFFSVVIPPASSTLLPDYGWQFQAVEASSGRALWTFTADQAQIGKVAARLTATLLPQVSGDSVYIPILDSTFDLHVVVLDAATGALKSKLAGLYFDDGTITGLSSMLIHTPRSVGLAVGADRVYVALRGDKTEMTQDDIARNPIRIVAFDGNLSSEFWSTDLSVSNSTANGGIPWLYSDDQQVYVAADKLTTLKATDGSLEAEEPYTAALLWTTDRLYKRYDVSKTVNKLDVIDRATGEIRWTYTMPADVGCTSFSANTINVYSFCVYADGAKGDPDSEWHTFLLALDVVSGTERWRKPIAENLFSVITQEPAALPDGSVAVIGGELSDMRVSVFAADGAMRWTVRVEETFNQVEADAEHIYVIDTAPRWRLWLATLNGEWR